MSEHALQYASRAHGVGDLDQAEGYLRSIPANAPEYVDAVMGLAVIAYQKGQPHEAAVQFSRMVALRPGQADHHCNLGECLRECGRLDEALAQLELGISIDPHQPDAYNSLGLIHHARKRLDQAEKALTNAIRLRPGFVMAMINLGMVLQERRRLRDAERWFRRALAIEPDNAMGNSNLGQILVEIGRIDDLDEAERLCRKAANLTPGRPQPINNLGNVYRAMGRFDEALECYRAAMRIAPGLAMPLNNMGQALQGRGRFDEAARYYLDALAIEPNCSRFHANLASMLLEQERPDEAISRFRHALAIDPDHAESYCGMGQIAMQNADVDQAEASFRKALEIDPELTAPRIGLANLYSEMGDFDRADVEANLALATHPRLVDVYYQRATHRKGDLDDADLDRMTALLDTPYLGETALAQINFALGVVHDKRRNYPVAGHHFREGNIHQAAMRAKRGETYDPDTFSRWISEVVAEFSSDQLARWEGIRHSSRRPIFVVGLPRSGTTLTEQILASHPAVHGAGECMFMNQAYQALPATVGMPGANVATALKAMTPEHLLAIAEGYLDAIASRNSTALHVVDKMPDNINLLGWIHLLFPHAKVVHCRRDLRDIALSCWQTCFGSIRWANDWTHIARRFSDYLRVVEHWRSVDGMSWMDLRYEAVIESFEDHARQLIDYVGLDWDPACLKFHETKRQVRTASLSQIREPIYARSVAKWRRYEDELRPFVDEMNRRGHLLMPDQEGTTDDHGPASRSRTS